ncbi:C10 family peptidase [Hufsiella ginkgonis]|uniref:Peptidase C39-like domain-containing protein n=1 Tax=Hufsiella ginkgonis TaxID=2695274 RepID=A0A7K1Y1X3_9SPHI|nr:C10 family peptidase [Hufsiella ginkgonis]MXV17273.1 hypothetical protein [Hufsiella ginkgonis]
MRTSIRIFLGGILLTGTTYVFAATSFPSWDKDSTPPDSTLLKTKWKQMGGFEQYTPDHLRLGCWSTALAQVMYYHRLKPFGHVKYLSTNGYQVDETIDSASVDLNLVVNQLDSATGKQYREQTARYNYYAALAVQKNFGRDNYMYKLAPANLLERHYDVKVNRYISWKGLFPYATGKLKKVIAKEIAAQRPVFLHFADLKNFGHSVVIDGCYREHGKLMVHLNQGQGGPQDGWYDFDGEILHAHDDALRVIYTFKPLGN